MFKGKVLDCERGDTGCHLVAWERHGGEKQRWRRDGKYLVNHQGHVMDIANSSRTPGAPILMWNKNTPETNNQCFEFVVNL